MGTGLKSKYIGCLLGAAIGDALGKQNEGIKRSEILKKGLIIEYGTAPAGCPGDKLQPGQYTDDTEQMLVLTRSLIDCNGFDVEDFTKRIALWGRDTLSDPSKSSLVGPASASAIKKLNSGIHWKESGNDTPSCGSAMRVAPIGLYYEDMQEIEYNAALSSIPTHINRRAIAGAIAVAVGVRCALLGMDEEHIMLESCKRASKYDVWLSEKIKLSFELRQREPDEVFQELGTSYLVIETVPSAFYCFFSHFKAPQNAILEAVNAGGDTDSIACITGALCGAFHGMGNLPRKWIDGLENKDHVMHLAEMLFDLRNINENIKNVPDTRRRKNIQGRAR